MGMKAKRMSSKVPRSNNATKTVVFTVYTRVLITILPIIAIKRLSAFSSEGCASGYHLIRIRQAGMDHQMLFTLQEATLLLFSCMTNDVVQTCRHTLLVFLISRIIEIEHHAACVVYFTLASLIAATRTGDAAIERFPNDSDA